MVSQDGKISELVIQDGKISPAVSQDRKSPQLVRKGRKSLSWSGRPETALGHSGAAGKVLGQLRRVGESLGWLGRAGKVLGWSGRVGEAPSWSGKALSQTWQVEKALRWPEECLSAHTLYKGREKPEVVQSGGVGKPCLWFPQQISAFPLSSCGLSSGHVFFVQQAEEPFAISVITSFCLFLTGLLPYAEKLD